MLPDRRLNKVVALSIRGIIGSESPVVTQMAQTVARTESGVWTAAKQIYRLLGNERVAVAEISQGLYELSQARVEEAAPAYAVVALDPVNFEKPYTTELEGVSTVHKSTPPPLKGQAHLTRGYPAITATVVNIPVPAVIYAHWFSYTAEFISENWEISQAISTTNHLLADYKRRYVGDAGLDDQKLFARLSQDEFVIRASHLERLVEVYKVTFTHARKDRRATIHLGWLALRLPDTHQRLWAIVAYEPTLDRTLVLLTNVPLHSINEVRQVYDDWRLRARIEHGYRFDQEQGLDVEDMRVQSLEAMQRLFILVLVAAQFVFYLIDTSPPRAVLWVRQLGGKLGLANDLDGPYLVLRGLKALIQTLVTLTFLAISPFPHQDFTCG